MKKVNTKYIRETKLQNKKFSALTAYDYSTAKILDEAGIDIILVGDSLAMVALGYDNTNNISIDEMKIFTKAVAKGVTRAMVVCDMPFMSYHSSIETAITNIGEAIKAGANAVKIEGSGEYICELIKRCADFGIPVISHIGFTPQSINAIGGHYIQGKTFNATLDLLEQAKKLEKAGAFAILLEMVPEESAKYITENINIPTISCGAGKYCDGQVLVCDDVFGKYSNFKPKFARRYADMRQMIYECAKQYDEDVKKGDFPNNEEVFHLEETELKQFYAAAPLNNKQNAG